MAIEYSSALDSVEDPLTIANWIAKDLSLTSKTVDGHHRVIGQGMVCTVMPQSALGHELVEEVFHIDTNVTIICQIDKFEYQTQGMESLVELCLSFLRNYLCDLVMLSNGERGLLLRNQGTVHADCREVYWKRKWHTALDSQRMSFLESKLPSL